MFKRILVAVDGSKTALHALDKAIELQQLTQAEIFLLCVFKHHSLFEASLSMVRPDNMQIPDQALTEYAKSVVEQAKAYATDREATCRGFVKGGRPSKTIIKFAKEKDVDLIVMGSHGTHTDVDGMILGSVSQRVAGRAHCPTLVV
ncbi:universal stress protein [Bermanella marisrubri]|uniref:Universal stress protein family protein n=1 Tax=Bermanella marisrubri TaxID=207949 RepID=Q1MYJ6_9GAMM|nr:universal stress protein [Bermanella marisrubri]EAT11035.1 universal stress protein family protein [Oceanobacter sp. RED65] [Bermanella marisrubri]QIZ82978.1 universal stress protein [Bermanella marisrubri]